MSGQFIPSSSASPPGSPFRVRLSNTALWFHFWNRLQPWGLS